MNSDAKYNKDKTNKEIKDTKWRKILYILTQKEWYGTIKSRNRTKKKIKWTNMNHETSDE